MGSNGKKPPDYNSKQHYLLSGIVGLIILGIMIIFRIIILLTMLPKRSQDRRRK